METVSKKMLEINYQKAAADNINQVKQDLATKDIKQIVRQEKEKETKHCQGK